MYKLHVYWDLLEIKKKRMIMVMIKRKKSIGRSFECCQRIFFCDIQNLSKMWVARKLYNFIHWSGDGGENDLKSISNIGIHRHVPNGIVHISPHQTCQMHHLSSLPSAPSHHLWFAAIALNHNHQARQPFNLHKYSSLLYSSSYYSSLASSSALVWHGRC